MLENLRLFYLISRHLNFEISFLSILVLEQTLSQNFNNGTNKVHDILPIWYQIIDMLVPESFNDFISPPDINQKFIYNFFLFQN